MSPEAKKMGKIVLKGKIKTISPLHIGCGSGEKSDLDILLDGEGKPFIPATSFVGVLHHLISENTEACKNEKEWHRFWGYSRCNEGHQSMFRCSDLLLSQNSSPKIVIRDGIRIDNKTGMVEDQKKYDYEILERGTRFDLSMEFSYDKVADEQFVKKMVSTIYVLLGQGIQIGAKTNSGLGQIELIESDTRVYHFDFSEKKDVLHWLTQATQNFSQKNVIPINELAQAFEITSNEFSITAILQLKNSLIIRSYSEEPYMPETSDDESEQPGPPDAVHMKSLNDWVLTGTSLKGAIRTRAQRIVNTLGKESEIIDELFGKVDDENRSDDARKGKIRVKESILPGFVAELQTRIKTDRFTGGTIETALFDTMPLWSGLDEVVSMEICVRQCKDHEAGLLLLVLKDLWTGDLAVGGEKNIGRGVFQGVKAIIRCNGDEPILIKSDLNNIRDGDRKKLEGYVDALNHAA